MASTTTKDAPAGGPEPPCGGDSLDGTNASTAGVPVERNRFFTGKYMTARDFRDEQAYFLGRHRLHHRALHGWGIVVGLDVCRHPDPGCADRGWLVVTPGIAIDPMGREVVIREATPLKIDALFPQDVDCGCEAQYGFPSDKVNDYWPNNGPPDDPHEFLLGVRYGERPTEPVPVLYDNGGCGERTAPNRLLERPCFRYRDFKPGDPCWGPANPPVPAFPPLPGTDPCHCLAGVYADPLGPDPCGPYGLVPLGRFRFRRGADDKIEVLLNDQTGRRYLFGPLHPFTLTHIARVSWHHGHKTHVHELTEAYERGRDEDEKTGRGALYARHSARDHRYLRLTFTFDGPLCDDDAVLPPHEPQDGIGFYRRFLRVRYETETGERRPLPHAGVAYLSHCRTKLHYDVPWHCLEEMRRHVRHPIVHVTLNCDFLPDRKGRAVDGNHLRGALARHGGKTGDGVEGGLFESWFRLEW